MQPASWHHETSAPLNIGYPHATIIHLATVIAGSAGLDGPFMLLDRVL